MPFYEYDQNNSGGSFFFDRKIGVSVLVIIEASSAEMANTKAEEIGLYFDGHGDCSCCGDRWYEQWGDSGSDSPEHYGKPIVNNTITGSIDWSARENNSDGAAYGYIHYLDGRVVPLKFRKSSR